MQHIHRLALQEVLVNPFLCGVKMQDRNLDCALPMLNQLGVKKLIAEFLGPPRGDHLCHLRAAIPMIQGALPEEFNFC